MLCSAPVTVGSQLFPCGRCDPCRINRKRLWTHRLLLEADQCADNSFWTLTYSDQNLPLSGNGLWTLAPEDAQRFMKRFRKAWDRLQGSFGLKCEERRRVRFFLVGEYGDRYERPHYHIALFGYPSCTNRTTLTSRGRPIADRCCVFCRTIYEQWGRGDIHGGTLEESSAKYLVGYVLKKMTRYDDTRLNGRMPEFARMSLRPGIGYGALHDVASAIMENDISKDITALRRGKTIYPLGRYLTQNLRQLTGKDKNAPPEVLQENYERLLPLRQAAKRDNQNPSFKSYVVEAYKQDILNRAARAAIYKKRGNL